MGVNAHFKVTVNGNFIGESYVASTVKDYIFNSKLAEGDIKNVKVEYDNDVYNEAAEEDRNMFMKGLKVGTSAINLEGNSITRSSGVWTDNGKMVFASNGSIQVSL
ncbi:MAG: hypothetical protein HC830_00610 [Bacteroidetes bacterium]|nr:hypothetical protein [Bacteroidota bacterium]